MRRFRDICGAGPLQLLVLLASLALTWLVWLRIAAEPTAGQLLAWFLGSVIGHDLVLLPVYAAAEGSLHGVASLLRRRRGRSDPAAVNFLRLPALGSGLLLLVFFPGILRQGAADYATATGQDQLPFLDRWLAITAALFAVGAVGYAIRLGLAARRRRPCRRVPRAPTG